MTQANFLNMEEIMKKGFTLIELLVVIAIIGILAAMLLPTLSSVQEKANQSKCRANVSTLGKSLKMYQQDYGKGTRFPEYGGSCFLLATFRTGILLERAAFLCPSTPDQNIGPAFGSSLPNPQTDMANVGLLALGTACTPNSTVLDVVANEYQRTSYAGRVNCQQTVYPGIFKLFRDSTITSMATDDFQGVEIFGNHETGNFINVLYVDAHVEGLKSDNINAVAEGDSSYTYWSAVPAANNTCPQPGIAHPITN